MAGLTTPPLTPPTTGHTGQGDDGAPDPSTESATRATVYDDPAFVSFFLTYCQGRYELSYRSETGI